MPMQLLTAADFIAMAIPACCCRKNRAKRSNDRNIGGVSLFRRTSSAGVAMIIDIDVLLDYGIPERHDVLLQVEAARMIDQRLITNNLTVTSPERLRAVEGEESIGQRTWAVGLGPFRVEYRAPVDRHRPAGHLRPPHAHD